MNWRRNLEEFFKSKPLIIIAGPTAVGKTNLSVNLAKRINGEIISADSMQVYKGMDIGTAKIKTDEMNGVRHHLIDILEPWEDFNVSKFKQYADNCIKEINERGHIPIITGGTGFYIQAVLNNIEFTEHPEDTQLREELYEYAQNEGAEALSRRLSKLDAKAGASIHPNNVKRVVRALAYCIQTGEKFSEYNERESQKTSPYNYKYFVLNTDRETLYNRIEQRIDIMLKEGLVDEVKGLVKNGCTKDMVSMKGLGYKEIIDYLDGTCSYDEAVNNLKKETRHFAKRQLTWFRREKDAIWIDKTNKDDQTLLDEICKCI